MKSTYSARPISAPYVVGIDHGVRGEDFRPLGQHVLVLVVALMQVLPQAVFGDHILNREPVQHVADIGFQCHDVFLFSC
jgi:hypothetical protein